MITKEEEDFIQNHAYVPEHIVGYGKTVSQGEPFLFEDFLCYLSHETLIFIGYPLQVPWDEKRMEHVLDRAIQKLNPAQIALIAPGTSRQDGKRSPEDVYYQIHLPELKISPKLKNMIQRASREVTVVKSREFLPEHQRIIQDFLEAHRLPQNARSIFQRIPAYLLSAPTAWLFNARDQEGKLVAFDIMEFGAKDYAFYMFNFRSTPAYVPGVSDLLLNQLIDVAREEGKSFVNLGLGINSGVAFFKTKWGGIPFLSYNYILYSPAYYKKMGSLLQKL
jgi:hypothetical protein